jgi:hypothetical protein
MEVRIWVHDRSYSKSFPDVRIKWKMSDKVMVWKFDTAPPELQALHRSGETPHWIALVPAPINGPDLDAAIKAQAGPVGMETFKTKGGDVIYIGSSDLKELMVLVSASWPDSIGNSVKDSHVA